MGSHDLKAEEAQWSVVSSDLGVLPQQRQVQLWQEIFIIAVEGGPFQLDVDRF